MNFSEIFIIGKDETLSGSKSRYVWLFSGLFIFLCFLVIHYSTNISFLLSDSKNIPYSLISYIVVLSIGPFMAMIASFDIVSSETETGSIRYIISKIHRSSFILGKFSFLALVFTFASSAIALMCLIYQSEDNVPQLENIFLLWIFSVFYFSSFISVFLFISTLSANNKISFTMSTIFLIILFFLFLQGDDSYLKYITPFFMVSKIWSLLKTSPLPLDIQRSLKVYL